MPNERVFDTLGVDAETRSLFFEGNTVNLKQDEWRLFECLLARGGEKIQGRDIVANAFDGDQKVFYSTLLNLRRRLGESSSRPNIIQSERRGRLGTKYWINKEFLVEGKKSLKRR